MNPDLRVLIETALEAFEGGRFQDFCLDFLPVYDVRFEGLARVGHTAEGKTRAGTPDLLKTVGDRQIAVQCGTNQDYWPPEKSVEGSKPYRDAMDCVQKLRNVVEIVLITNRDTPARTPNVRAAISAALARETTATITLLGREDLAQYLTANVNEARVANLLAHYAPTVARALEGQQEAAQNRILREIAQSQVIDLGAALRVLDDAMRATTGFEEAAVYALEQAQALSGCRLHELPPLGGIVRASVAALPLAAPFGKVWALTGAPKAGKTNALRQLVTAWGDDNVLWFECPITETDTCSDEIGAAVLRLLLPDEPSGPLVRSATRLERALARATTPTPTVIVVDNADRLSDAGLGRLAATLEVLRRHGALANLAYVFVAASGLHRLRAVVDDILTTPAWSIDELRELLTRAGVALDPERPDQYLETLTARSGSHPLVAMALARRYPRFEHLVLSSLEHVPGLADERLSREVQQLLYAELLTDADAQNIVQRASLFIERIPPDVMEALRTAVSPPIATATAVLLDRLSPTVIEGTPDDGYHVAFVFGEIAKQKLSTEEQRAVHEAAANALLRPVGQTLPADRICWGIFHAMLAMQIERALMWTATLGRGALAQRLPDDQMRALLDQLSIVRVMSPSPNLRGWLAHTVAFITLGQLYARVRDYETAAEVFVRIRLDEPAGAPPEVVREMPAFRLAITLGRATYLLAADRPGARSVVATLREPELATMTPAQWDVTLEILAEVVVREGLGDGLPAIIRVAVAAVDPANMDARAASVRLGAVVGVATGLVEGDAGSLPVCFPDTTFGQMLQRVAEGTFAMQGAMSRERAPIWRRPANAHERMVGQLERRGGNCKGISVTPPIWLEMIRPRSQRIPKPEENQTLIRTCARGQRGGWASSRRTSRRSLKLSKASGILD